MQLSQIEIENFKAIGERQTIDLKPITLLFGPNSVGKSTILQALHYVREILERHNPDPDQTIAGGPIDLGGFKAIVHNHKRDRAMKIKLVVDLFEEQGRDYLPLNSGSLLQDVRFANLDVHYLVGENVDFEDYAIVQEVAVSIEVRWSELLDGPYVSLLAIELDGESVAAIESPPQERRGVLTAFNFSHPLLKQIRDEEDHVDDDASSASVSPLDVEVWELSRDMARETAALEGRDFRVSVATKIGALPDLNVPLRLELRDPEERDYALERSTPRVQGLTALLDELILGPVRIVRQMLRNMAYIGPLREIPPRGFRPRLSPDESRWAKGLAAWDLLYADNKGDLTAMVNDWLSDDDKLGIGYRVDKVVFRKIPVPGRLNNLFERGLREDDLGELQELYENLGTRIEVALQNFDKGIIVAPDDVGVGISQMIPIVVGCVADSIGLLVVEQPELHVHPAVQVGMGDLFIHSVSKQDTTVVDYRSLLVETHSEHIMLRLLRRIRETAEGVLPPGVLPFLPDQLSIVYVETSSDGVKFRSLRVDREGEFIDRWPHGFFDERAEELF